MSNSAWSELATASRDFLANIRANAENLGQTAARDFATLRAEIQSAFDSTRSDVRDVGSTIRASPRYVRVAAVLGRIGARHKLAQSAPDSLRFSLIEASHRQSAIEIRDLCAELGGGILKVGQLLSARADLLPAAYIEQLRTLQDRAPSSPFSELAELVATELGAPCEEIFKTVEDVAMAAASLAQVHVATLLDGRKVAIKVQRPGVRDLVVSDLRIVNLLARVFADSVSGVDLRAVAVETERFLTDELDFRLEAAHLKHFATLATGDERWSVPILEPQFSTERVIVMELIRGQSLSAYLETAEKSDVARVLGLLVEQLAAQILRHGIAHGDPHPGNLLIDEDGRLVFVDFGCVLELKADERAAYVTLVMAIVGRNPESIASALAAAGFSASDPDALIALARLFLEAFEPGKLGALDPTEQVAEALRLTREAGTVRVPRSFVLIGRIVALVGGLVLHFRPDIDLASLLLSALRPTS